MSPEPLPVQTDPSRNPSPTAEDLDAAGVRVPHAIQVVLFSMPYLPLVRPHAGPAGGFERTWTDLVADLEALQTYLMEHGARDEERDARIRAIENDVAAFRRIVGTALPRES